MANVVMSLISIAMAVGSAVQQQRAAKKAKKAAEEAADARKGYEIPVEGEPSNLPLVYGRALLGGVRVFHGTRNGYTYNGSNADKVLQTNANQSSGGTLTTKVWNYDNPVYTTNDDGTLSRRPTLTDEVINYTAGSNGLLNQSRYDDRNGYLTIQQAICQGEIHNLLDIIIDDSRLLTDCDLAGSTDHNRVTTAVRVDFHNNGGADAVGSANFSELKTATFNNIAYANITVKNDRDDPQWSSVPSVQFLVEGKTVRNILGGSLSTEYAYSNNPALCLLDYLLEPISGKNLPLSSIDLDSFEEAAIVCDMLVKNNAAVSGHIWKPTDRSRNVRRRDIPLYECNIVVDTSKTIRTNVEAILATMGDARLLWSGGKYKLQVEYPLSNEQIDIATTITDDDLHMDQTVEIAAPSMDTKLNHCIVKYHNEFNDFREDSVSWPDKTASDSYRGVGGQYYDLQKGSWEHSTAGVLKTNYGVWDGDETTIELGWSFKLDSGVYGGFTLYYNGDITNFVLKDDQGISVIPTSVVTLPDDTSVNLKVDPVSGVEREEITKYFNNEIHYYLGSEDTPEVYNIVINAVNSSLEEEDRVVAATLSKDTSDVTYWSTRAIGYESFEFVHVDNALYSIYLEEDGNIELEAEVFEDGITDYYHALAKAEENVRISRTTDVFSFKYLAKDKFLEPGDYIKFESETLGLGLGDNSLYLKIDKVKLDTDNMMSITATRFDYSQLAWNVEDDAYLTATPLFSAHIPAPRNFAYSTESARVYNSSGKLTWEPVNFYNITNYIVYAYFGGGDLDAYTNSPIFNEIGRTTDAFFILPWFDAPSALYGVRAVSENGRTSKMVFNDSNAAALPTFWGKEVVLSSDVAMFKKFSTGEVLPDSITITSTMSQFNNPHIKWYADEILLENENGATLTVPYFTDTEFKRFRIAVEDDSVMYSAVKDLFYLEVPYLTLGVDNLRVSNSTGDDVTFQTADCQIAWDYPTGTWANLDWLYYYVVRIYAVGQPHTLANVLYEENVGKATVFDLNFDKNSSILSGPLRTFEVTVSAVATDGNEGAETTIVPINYQAGQVTGVETTLLIGGVTVDWNTVEEYDLVGYSIYIGDVSTFVPSVFNKFTSVGKNTLSCPMFLPAGTVFIKVCAFDIFGEDSLVYSVVESVVIDHDIPATNVNEFFEEISKLYKYPVMEAESFSATTYNISWNAHFIYFDGIKYSISAGSTSNQFVYWHVGNGFLSTTADGTIFDGLAKQNGDWQIAKHYPATGAMEIVFNAQANALIGSAMIGVAAVQNVNIGQYIQSDDFYLNPGTNANGWQIDKAGVIRGTGIEIYSPSGNLLLGSGTSIETEWNDLLDTYGTKPANNATRGATIGGTLTGRFTEVTAKSAFGDNGIPGTFIESLAAEKLVAGVFTGFTIQTVDAVGPTTAGIILSGQTLSVYDGVSATPRVKLGFLG